MNVTEKFRIIILEGGDLCGKTTQAMELMKKFDNAIYFKFPTTNTDYSDGITQVFKDLHKHVYNERNVKIAQRSIEDGYYDNDILSLMLEIIQKDIMINYYDKCEFLNNLKNYIINADKHVESENMGKFISNLKLKTSKYSAMDGDHNSSAENNESVKRSLLTSMLNDDKPIFLIFDRFLLSGLVYNTLLPLEFIKKHSNQNIHDYFKTQIESLTKDYTESLICKMNTLFDSQLPLSPYALHSNILQIVFNNSKFLYNKTMKDKKRKMDDYDSNVEIRDIVGSLFKTFPKCFEEDICADYIMLDIDKFVYDSDISNLTAIFNPKKFDKLLINHITNYIYNNIMHREQILLYKSIRESTYNYTESGLFKEPKAAELSK